jgi:putative endonuclease
MHTYYVYILASKPNGTLYIGVTNNLERRLFEHKHELADGFTKKYGVKTSSWTAKTTVIRICIFTSQNCP